MKTSFSSQAESARFDIKSILVGFSMSVLLLLTNVAGLHQNVYVLFDQIYNPFLISARNTALSGSLFLHEVTNKGGVLSENIELRRELVRLEETKSENAELKNKIAFLETQTSIKTSNSSELVMINVVGVQNLFSINPQVLLYLENDAVSVKPGSVVLYDKNVLFGFVSEVSGKTVRVNLFYSPELDYKVPVQSISNLNQKGFVSAIENGVVKVKNLPKEYKIQEGDIWMTTNDVVDVPPSLIVGKVKNVIPNQQDGFQDIELTLPFSLANLRYVLISK